MFTDDAPSFTGKHYRVEKIRNLPRPIRPEGIPIMVGGGGEKRTLRLVAQYADQCNVAGDIDTIHHKLEVLRRHCDDVGRDPDEIRTTRLGSLFLTDSPQQTIDTRAMMIDLAGEEFAAGCTIGNDDEVVEQVAIMIDAGIDEPIFNMPFSDSATIRRAGELLSKTF